jgi:hypothetical protein
MSASAEFVCPSPPTAAYSAAPPSLVKGYLQLEPRARDRDRAEG